MDVTPHQGGVFCPRSRPEATEQTDKTRWRDSQHGEHEHANEQQAILAERRQRLGQQHYDDRSNQRSAYRVDAADHDDEHKQDPLEERKRIRADEVCDPREDATSDACCRSRDSETRWRGSR